MQKSKIFTWTRFSVLCLGLVCLLALTACGNKYEKLLSADKPTTIVVWHYYNGQLRSTFDSLTEEFNNTVGLEKGIIVESASQGDVSGQAEAVYNAAIGALGSAPMPNIFAAYADNAIRIDDLEKIVDLSTYFSKEELDQYNQDFLNSGRLGADNKVKILPIAKSTENMFVNTTDFNKFAADSGAKVEDLTTWEGVLKTAEAYYNWTDAQTATPGDGKAFFGLDSFANFFYSVGMQYGVEFFPMNNGQIQPNLDKETLRIIFDNFYVPHIKGYYGSFGRFRSDDAKTGDVIAYVGSTSGANYVPREVTIDNGQPYAIDMKVTTYPVFQGKKPYVIQQGAGMAIATSTPEKEYASAVFLKWLTDNEQNLIFAAETGYVPVKTGIIDGEQIKLKMSEKSLSNNVLVESTMVTVDMLKTYNLYANQPFEGSYDIRNIIDDIIKNMVLEDNEMIKQQVAAGKSRADVLATIDFNAKFEQWYNQLSSEISAAISKAS